MRDRVRVSPDVGQWLRLEVGQRVIMHDRLLVVVSRQAVSNGRKTGVRYRFCELDCLPTDKAISPVPPLMLDEAGSIVNDANQISFWLDGSCESS